MRMENHPLISDEELLFFKSCLGSHIWGMNHRYSDIDVGLVYLMNSRDVLLGKRVKPKHQLKGYHDYVCYELGHVISHLLKGNVNFLWLVFSPIIMYEYKCCLTELKKIVLENLSKNFYHSINGLANHNLHHLIEGINRKEIEPYSLKFKKKLNIIGRTLIFGINLFLHERCIFEKVDINSEEEIHKMWSFFQELHEKSKLPPAPNPKPFEDYLIKWRLQKMELDGMF